MYDPSRRLLRRIHAHAHPYGEVTFDQDNAAFRIRGQWGDCRYRLAEMALDERDRLWVTDHLGGKLWILPSP